MLFAIWLAGALHAGPALDWETREGYRVAPLQVPKTGKPGFVLLPGNVTGIRFTNTLPEERIMTNANLLNGSGVALGDYDGDGLCDIYLCDLNGANALYRNLGNWTFTNVTDSARVACPGQTSTGAVFADINGDGHLDLLVTSMGGPNACFLNDGHGHFTNVTAAAGLISRLGSTSMALADIDGDGTLDLYVANYGANSILRSGGAISYRTVNGKPVVSGRHAQRIKIIDGVMYELGEPHVLYLNDGKGNFRPVPWTQVAFLDESGKPLAEAPWDQGLSALFRDINGDGFPDLYVCNDAFTPDRCWINDGHGRFRALSTLAWRQTSYFSMGADFADIDRDGHDDFMVADMLSRDHRLFLTQIGNMHPQPRVIGDIASQPQIRRNTLFLARGDGTFAEIANFSGVAASEWTWSVVFLDVDLDGWEDILVTNGFAYNVDDIDSQERIKRMGPISINESRRSMLTYPRLETPNLAFRNRHDRTFDETGKVWGFNSPQVSNGMAMADLDNDGDLDVVISCLNAPALIYRNETSAPRVAVRLKGIAPNTQGIGAKIKVLGGPVTQTQEVICGGRYMSGDDPMRVFAAGTLTNKMTIEVTWRSGRRSVISDAKANRIYEIEEAGALAVSDAQPSTLNPQPLFRDVSDLIAHAHHEEPFDDFARQPLLPKRLSQSGPGVAWYDLDGDGHDELIVGSGKGGQVAVYRADGKGGLHRWQSEALKSPASDDLTGVIGWTSQAGQRSLLVGLSNYESAETNASTVLRYDMSATTLAPGSKLEIRSSKSAIGPLAAADIDGDGDLDLFVGGRMVPGRYPEPSSSLLFRNNNGNLEPDQANNAVLQNVGLVSGAVFSDLNSDGLPELVLACDWGPVRVFLNEAGRLREVTTQLGLARFTGWWNGVATGDFDGDGRMDIVASNWGLNSPYRCTAEQPVGIFYGDIDGNGTLDLIEAYTDAATGKIVPRRNFVAVGAALPFLRIQYPTHDAFSRATVGEILKENLSRARQAQASTLASMVFLNRGDHFEAAALPDEAQFAPAFSVNIGDLDGDGREDIFLSQNFFATQPDLPRLDAGRGLWLRGDGAGKFVSVPGQESGVKVYGEQRGAALGDFDEDGRIDLVVTQNGAATKLYRNERAQPGLRVRLAGPPGNPDGIGSVVRLKFGDRWGPAKEIHGGSGYWSQDSATLVFGTPARPTQVSVKWAGGTTTNTAVPTNAAEVTIDLAGDVKKSH